MFLEKDVEESALVIGQEGGGDYARIFEHTLTIGCSCACIRVFTCDIAQAWDYTPAII